MLEILEARRHDQREGWVFPSDSKPGHVTTVAKAFEEAREAAGLSKEIKLYSARHTFATKVMGATGDLALVMRVLGHTNAQTAMIYQHPCLERVRRCERKSPARSNQSGAGFGTSQSTSQHLRVSRCDVCK